MAELVGHWPLHTDTLDRSPYRHSTLNTDVVPDATPHGGAAPSHSTAQPSPPQRGASFNGRGASLSVEDHPALRFGSGDFTVAVWLHTDATTADVVGSIVSKFDSEQRTGWHLFALTHAGLTTGAQPNYRHLQFGIDSARVDPAWTDCGRPGNAAFVPALLSTGHLLYAATLELGDGECGAVWRYDGGQKWVSLGNPARSSVIQSLVQFRGALYCGTGRYIGAGSVIPEPRNQTPGGTVWRMDPLAPERGWEYCGHPGAEGATPEAERSSGFGTGKADDVVALTVFHGALYCASNHRRGVFRYDGGDGGDGRDGGTTWTCVGLEDQRIMSFTIYRGRLYALINGGPVYRYEGESGWSFAGLPDRSTQTYAAVTVGGHLYAGTWPEGEVLRFDGAAGWELIGRVGFEREVMAMAHYNGKMYAGTLPMASVFRLDGRRFTLTGTLDQSSAPLRRVWAMAVHQGRLYAGTLPSGHVLSLEAGKMVTLDEPLPAGWHHVAAVKRAGRLELYLDSALVGWSFPFHPSDYPLDTTQPLRIGFGAYEYFDGLLADVRLYRGALTQEELKVLVNA